MRNCPICDSSLRKQFIPENYQNDWLLYQCLRCEHLYLDYETASQELLNNYYLKYSTDTDLRGPDTHARLASLAKCVKALSPNGFRVDIGGVNSELRSLVGMDAIGPGDLLRGSFYAITLSHTLEHIYDVQNTMKMIHDHLKTDGFVIIEGPYWSHYDQIKTYDVNWQHVNKFRVQDYNILLYVNGFLPITDDVLPDYRGFKCYRIILPYI